jgi:hypothetical protein
LVIAARVKLHGNWSRTNTPWAAATSAATRALLQHATPAHAVNGRNQSVDFRKRIRLQTRRAPGKFSQV